jgi:AsmA protein
MTLSRFIRSKHLVRGILLALALLFAARAAIPFLVQTETVERGIKASLEAWTGASVEIGRAPEFAFWPYPRVTLGNVRVVANGSGGGIELARIEAVSATFDLIGTLRGHPDFSEFELARPVVHLAWNEEGVLNWRRSGWLMQAIEAIAKAPDGQVQGFTHERIGTITVTDGSILVAGDGEKNAYGISDINGNIAWPVIRERLNIALSGVVNGEMARWTFESQQPLALLAGQNAKIRTSLVADPMTLNFDGIANLSRNAFIGGNLNLATPSLGHLLSWQGKDIPVVGNLGQLTVEAKITTAGYSAKLEGLKLGLENAQATGVLDVSMPNAGRPQVGGTLAFDRIDLKAFLSAFSPLPGGEETGSAGIDTAFMRQVGLDLRLSAKTAEFAPFSFRDLAAGVRIENGKASFDVGDSAFMDGRMSGRIALTEQGFSGGGQVQMSLRDVDLAGIVKTLDVKGPLPVGRASADFELSTDRPLWATSSSDVSGRFRLAMDNGVLSHFNREAFEALVSKNSFFNMSEAANGSFEFTQADVEARLDHGIAELTKAVIQGSDKTLTFSGMIPYRTGSVALAGSITDRQDTEATTMQPSVRFFVGGSWPEPVISPASVLTGQPVQ